MIAPLFGLPECTIFLHSDFGVKQRQQLTWAWQSRIFTSRVGKQARPLTNAAQHHPKHAPEVTARPANVNAAMKTGRPKAWPTSCARWLLAYLLERVEQCAACLQLAAQRGLIVAHVTAPPPPTSLTGPHPPPTDREKSGMLRARVAQ